MQSIDIAIVSAALLGLAVCRPQHGVAAPNEFFAMDNAIRDVKRLPDKAALPSA